MEEVIYMTPRKYGKNAMRDFYFDPKSQRFHEYEWKYYDEVHHFSTTEFQYKMYSLLTLSKNFKILGDIVDFPALNDMPSLDPDPFIREYINEAVRNAIKTGCSCKCENCSDSCHYSSYHCHHAPEGEYGKYESKGYCVVTNFVPKKSWRRNKKAVQAYKKGLKNG